VSSEDVKRAYELFIDVKRSTAFLKAHQAEYVFSTNDGEDGDEEDDDDDEEEEQGQGKAMKD